MGTLYIACHHCPQLDVLGIVCFEHANHISMMCKKLTLDHYRQAFIVELSDGSNSTLGDRGASNDRSFRISNIPSMVL